MYLKPNHTRNRLAYYILLLMGIYSGICLFIFVVLTLDKFHLLDRLGMGLRWGGDFMIGQSASTAAFILGFMEATLAIVFALWMARSLRNLIGLGVRTNYGPFSAAFSWFIPIGQFWMPYQAIKEMINKYSSMVRFFNEHRDVDITDRSKILNTASLWWGLWIFLWPFSFGFGAYWIGLVDQEFDWDEKYQFILVSLKIAFDMVLILYTMRLLNQINHLEVQAYQLWDQGRIDRYRQEKEARDRLNQDEANPEGEGDAARPDWLEEKETAYIYAEENLFDA